MSTRAAAALAIPVLLAAVGCSRSEPPAPVAAASPTQTPDPMRALPTPLPMVAARVNGQEIPIRNVAIMVVESIELGRASESRRNALYREALDQLIKREVLLQEAQARGIKADDLEVQKAYDRLRGQHRDDTEWNGFLKDRSLTDEMLRTELRVRHTVEALLQAEARKQTYSVSEEEARALYDQSDASNFQRPGASPGPKPPFEAVKELMRREALSRKYAAASEAFAQSLLAKARVEKFL